MVLHCDSSSAQYSATNSVYHERIKHMKVDCHFTGVKVNDKEIRLEWTHGRAASRLCTKALRENRLMHFQAGHSRHTCNSLREYCETEFFYIYKTVLVSDLVIKETFREVFLIFEKYLPSLHFLQIPLLPLHFLFLH